MDEFSEIIKSHPGIVLISENPVTWMGFLIVDVNLGLNIDIKLTVPNYPRVRDVTLLFGQNISLLHGTGFDERVMKLLENASSVSSLLLQLKRVVTNLIKNKYADCGRDIVHLQRGIVGDLKAALQLDSRVAISASSGLSSVKLSLNDVAVIMRNDGVTGTWKVLSSDLPKLACLEPFQLNLGSLTDAMTKLQTQVDMLQDTWNELNEIDNSCWVVDPPQPKPYHLYRRVKLTQSLSALITIDPIHVIELPNIKLLGSDSDVAKYRNIMNSNILKWSPDSSIVDNLRILMAIDELPRRPEFEQPLNEDAIVGDEECCICFSMDLEDTSPPQLPVEICGNEKCRRHFHTYCLLQCLQSNAVNQVSFDRIHGNCPNCSENISCAVRVN